MKEIREILKEVATLPAGEKAVLATVVDLKGSGYRLPGARMLIKANGDATGTVSGGCLEADVMERAKRVLETGRAEVFTYDTTSHEDSVFSLNMGCRGVMRILLEAVNGSTMLVRSLQISRERREAQTVATLISTDSTEDLNIGGRMFFSASEQFDSDFLPNRILSSQTLSNTLEEFFKNGELHGTESLNFDSESVEFVFERIDPPVQLNICGAGADAVPLAQAAHGLGWEVNVCDHRPAFLTAERFPNSDALISLDRDVEPDWDVDHLTAFVLMNHNYDRDRAMLPGALRSKAFYVGALGPKKRTQQILEELGNPFNDDEMSRLRSPAGLDIGGDTPEAIAISIIAEIQSVLKHRSGRPLRDRQAPIYDRK